MAGIAVQQRRPMASLRTNPSSPWRHLDFFLLATVGLVCLLGAVMVYSATRGAEEPYDTSFLKKQVMFLIFGALVMTATVMVDYRRMRDAALSIYGGTCAALALVLVPGVGSRQNGTQGWFQLGPVQLQPSEFAKLGLIIGFAAVASRYEGRIGFRRLATLLAMGILPMALVMLQPDLGTTLVSVFVTVILLVAAGASGRQLAALGALALLFSTLVLRSGMLGDYQEDRLTSFVEQDRRTIVLSEANSADYNLTQAKIAIGSGGFTGKGLFNGPQTRLRSVPYQHTDFIFTAVGEQLGLLGGTTLLALFAVTVWRIWRTAQRSDPKKSCDICAGVLAMFVFQIFENVGMTMGIMPITGIPLPFMSYGGSSTLTNFLAMGLVLNVHMRRFS
jgi:rod shape determining protein RodA